MRFFSPTRTAVLLLAAGCGLLPSSALYGQPGALPATQPTAGTAIAVPASALTRAELASHRAEVTYVAGMLEVTASNSSLNQILREISRRTGMKITGGVVDERVYGKYGPGAPGKILSSLLEGTGSNMLLVHNGPELADELILTPRRGGPTPPSPNASSSDDDRSVDLPPQRIVPVSNAVAPLPAPPAGPIPPRPVTSSASGFVSAPTSAPATEPGTTPGPTTQETGKSDPQPADGLSPNGVRTPQQIYEMLQKMRQQQPVTPPTPSN
jgi:hypothetical protein